MSTIFKTGRRVNHFLFRSPKMRWKMRLLGMTVLSFPPLLSYKRKQFLRSRKDLPPQDVNTLENVNCRISTSDTMFAGDLGTYLLVGLSGLRVVERALERCPSLKVRRVLDLPCGCGRVGRYLAARFPEAEVTACDLMKEGVDFCAQKFRMRPVYSQPDFEKLDLGKTFDLIWCGSLVTHLNPADVQKLLSCFNRHLNPGGLVVFTTHGDFVAQQVADGAEYGISKEAAEAAVKAYRTRGVAFVSYINHTEDEQYGFSLTSPGWIRGQGAESKNWGEAFFEAKGWDQHHDVFGFVKAGI